MPLTTTSTIDAARGLGFGVGASSAVLTTYTFPAGVSTWTAPAGVTLLVSASGKGADGIAPSWDSNASIGYSLVDRNAGGGYSNTEDWSTIYNEALSLLSVANAGGTGTRTISAQYYIRYVDPADKVSSRITLNYTYTIRGTITGPNQALGALTSGQITYVNGAGWWEINGDLYDPGSTGSDTTGFSLTFPGGTPSSPAAPLTTFTNVSVIPGVTYTINNNQSLVITYYA